MPVAPIPAITAILADPALNADERARRLLPIIYKELRALAQQQMARERRDHTLSATALVHEAYARLAGERRLAWQTRAHYFIAAAEAMRQVLLDHARAKGRQKRGGDRRRVDLASLDLSMATDPDEILSLDDALCRLTDQEPEIGRIVHLRFYAGLSVADTAAALDLSPATVKRRWEFARAWLFRELSGTSNK